MERKRIMKNNERIFIVKYLFNKTAKNFGINLKVLFTVTFLSLFSFVYSQNQTTQIPKLQQEDIEVITEAYNLWKTKGENIWKGWTQINMPFIYKKKRFEYWIDFPSAINKGQFIEKINNMNVYGQATTNPNGLAASMDISNVSAVVLSSPEITGMSKEEWIITAIH